MEMTSDRARYVIVATTIVQVALSLFSGWAMWSVQVASGQYVRVNGGEPIRYNLWAILVPGALLVFFGTALIAAVRWHQLRHSQWIIVVSHGLALAVIVSWWVALRCMNYSDYALFVASGRLAPNEIMGSDWQLAIVVLSLSLAALLGLIPLVWSALLARRANS